jgi:hypothetical protein
MGGSLVGFSQITEGGDYAGCVHLDRGGVGEVLCPGHLQDALPRGNSLGGGETYLALLRAAQVQVIWLASHQVQTLDVGHALTTRAPG